ncbi:MAG: aquaporin [Balneola sp.]
MGLKNNKYLIECVGSYFLVLAYGISGDALAIGFMLSALIYIGAVTSGAHYNPAISFGAFLLKRISGVEFLVYVLAQIIGAFLAASTILMFSGAVFYVEPPIGSTFYQQVGVEALFSIILVLVAFVAWIGKSANKIPSAYAVIMGFALIALVTIGQGLSGAFFNPAISISTSILDFSLQGSSYVFVPIYTIAPLFGASLAVLIYKYLIEEAE